MEFVHVSAFVTPPIAEELQKKYKEYCASNKERWIPFGKWLGMQLSIIFNSKKEVLK